MKKSVKIVYRNCTLQEALKDFYNLCKDNPNVDRYVFCYENNNKTKTPLLSKKQKREKEREKRKSIPSFSILEKQMLEENQSVIPINTEGQNKEEEKKIAAINALSSVLANTKSLNVEE